MLPHSESSFPGARIQVDRDQGQPLYQQIAGAIRYRVFTGALRPGDALPSVREAQRLWGVHHHTVRRAYLELAKDGLVDSRPGIGTRVLAPRPPSTTLWAHLQRFLEEVESLFGAGADDVRRLLETLEGEAPATRRALVWVVECSVALSCDLASQCALRWGVDARPWPLDRLEAIPDGRILTTHFHAKQVADAVAGRKTPTAIEHVAVQLDGHRVRAIVGDGEDTAHKLILCQGDADPEHGISDDLKREAGVEVVVTAHEREALELASASTPLVFSPSLWDQLEEGDRHAPWVHCLPARFDPTDDPVIEAFLADATPGPTSEGA